MAIVRNSYPVLKDAVKHCRLYIVICLFTVWCRVNERVTTAWIKSDVCRALYTVYRMKVMQLLPGPAFLRNQVTAVTPQ
jgi:hypothetical protein